MIRLSICIPVFNEERNIGKTVAALIHVLPLMTTAYEIIIIDDGSVDQTVSTIRRLQEKYSSIRLIVHNVNKGYGAALRTGFTNAQFDWVFITDGDGQFEFTQLHSFTEHHANFDMIIGYRLLRHDNAYRLWVSRFGNWIVHRSFHITEKDVGCAFKLIRKDALRRMYLSFDGAMLNTELFIQAKKLKLRIKELPVAHFPRTIGHPTGGSAKVLMKTMLNYIQLLCLELTRRGR